MTKPMISINLDVNPVLRRLVEKVSSPLTSVKMRSLDAADVDYNGRGHMSVIQLLIKNNSDSDIEDVSAYIEMEGEDRSATTDSKLDYNMKYVYQNLPLGETTSSFRKKLHSREILPINIFTIEHGTLDLEDDPHTHVDRLYIPGKEYLRKHDFKPEWEIREKLKSDSLANSLGEEATRGHRCTTLLPHKHKAPSIERLQNMKWEKLRLTVRGSSGTHLTINIDSNDAFCLN